MTAEPPRSSIPKSKAAMEIDALFAWVKKQANVQTGLRENPKTRKQG